MKEKQENGDLLAFPLSGGVNCFFLYLFLRIGYYLDEKVMPWQNVMSGHIFSYGILL